MKSVFRNILLISLIGLILPGNLAAQKKKTTRIQVAYIQDHNRVEHLIATLKVKEKRYELLSNSMINFYSVNDTSRVLLAKIKTNNEGQAIFAVTENPKIYQDPEGLMILEIEYNGNTANNPAKKKIKIKRAQMEVTFFQKDSIKSIQVAVKALDGENKALPLAGKNILFYVKGTFSLLNFGKIKTNDDGIAQIDFPVDMPGSPDGNLTIVAKIEEDRSFGTIEARGEINWATPIQPVKEKKRGLGDTDAPLWMVYTLIILLSAVWFHYAYVIFLIIKIKLSRHIV